MKRRIIPFILFILLLAAAAAADWDFPGELQTVEEEAFAGISDMGMVRLPPSLRHLGRRAFAGSTIGTLDLPAFLEDIDDEALDGAEIGRVTAVPGTAAYDWAVAKGYIVPYVTPAEDFEWEIVDDAYVSIIRYTGTDALVVVPGEIGGLPVRRIGSQAFMGNSSVTELVIPDGVERIMDRAFNNMGNLKTAILPDSVTYLGIFSFTNCASLETFRYPLNLAEIGSENVGSLNVFQGCTSLKRIDVPEGVTRIPENTFRRAYSLEKVGLPSTLKEIGSMAFLDSDSIETLTFPEGLERIESSAFSGMDKLKTMDLPDSVTYIGAYAFTNCPALETFHYPEGLAELGYVNSGNMSFFQGCTSLKRIDVPEGVVRLPDMLFRRAWSLEEVGLPATLKVIGSKAFQNCTAIETITIPAGLERVEDNAFQGMTALKAIELPDSVTFIGAYAFSGDNALESFRYPLGLTEVGYDNNGNMNVFRDCDSLKRIVVPEGVTRIPDNLFRRAYALQEVVLPSTLKEIGGSAFRDCTGIESLPVPDGLERIEYCALQGMTSLKAMELPDSVTFIGAFAFSGDKALESFRYPLGLTEVGFDNSSNMNVFRDCDSLKRIVVPEGVTRIPDHLFRRAYSLEEVVLPSTLKVIGSNAFRECTGIESLPVPAGLEQVEGAAFYGMTSLKAMELPDSVNLIGCYAFFDCASLETFRYPLGLETVIYDNNVHMTVFKGCSSLKQITVPEGVTRIPAGLFRLAASLEEISLPMSLREIGDRAFEGCEALPWLYVNENVYQIGRMAFYSAPLLTVESEYGAYTISYCQSNSVPYYYLSPDGVASPSGTLYRGDPFTIYGYARSTVSLTEVTAAIWSGDGSTVLQSVTVNPQVTDYSLCGSISRGLHFEQLGLGSYRYTLHASTDLTQENWVSTSFTVVPPPLRINLVNPVLPEGLLDGAAGFTLGGTIYSNYPITGVYAGVLRAEEWQTGASASPGTYQYDMSGLTLSLQSLPAGEYVCRITAEANGETRQLAASAFEPVNHNIVIDDQVRAKVLQFVNNSSNFNLFRKDYTSGMIANVTWEDMLSMAVVTRVKWLSGGIQGYLFSHDFNTVENNSYMVNLYEVELASVISTINEQSVSVPPLTNTASYIFDCIEDGSDISVGLTARLALDHLTLDDEAISQIKAGCNEYEVTGSMIKSVIDGVILAEDFKQTVTNIICNNIKGMYVIGQIAQYIDQTENRNMKEAVRRLYAKYTGETMNKLITYMEMTMDYCVEEGISIITNQVFTIASKGAVADVSFLYTLINLGIDITNKYNGVEDHATALQNFIIQRDYYDAAVKNYRDCFEAVAYGDTSEGAIRNLLCAFDLAKETCLRVHRSGLDMESWMTIYINYQIREETEQYIRTMQDLSIL